jgi:tRNA-2-methylthio-N6-dimethylallyladenosine synthase
VHTDFPAKSKFDDMPPAGSSNVRPLPPQAGQHRGQLARRVAPVSAFLTVQEGCDKFCTFCVVPYTRGAEASRPVARIVEEAAALVARGAKEVMLLGQNVNAYHGEGPDGRIWSLARLLERLSDIRELKRLRYTTSHPRDMSNDLVAAHRDLPKLMPYLHLPVQSGSDRILDRMNRKHHRRFYLELVGRLREARPDLALSGDFIVGFPGESEEDFSDTMNLIEEIGYAGAFSFKYSPRPGTPAAEAPDQVPEEVKAERLARLQALIQKQQVAFNASMPGRVTDVLLEKPGAKPGQLVGRSPYLQAVQVDAPASMIGSIVSVAIERIGANSLFGALNAEQAPERAIA